MSFTLAGFSGVKREGVEVTGAFTEGGNLFSGSFFGTCTTW